MAAMTPETWEFINRYSLEVFGQQDEHLAGLMEEAVEAGLPAISIGPDVGRLLMILTSMTEGRLAVEVGTLGGYSGIWLARGLRPGGRLITIESEPSHAHFAERQFARAGLSDRVEIRIGPGLEVLSQLGGELEPDSVDVLFLDAENRVLSAHAAVPPFRLGLAAKRARSTLELPAGTLAATGTRAGDTLHVLIART